MKYRYIYEQWGEIYCKAEITKDDLIRVKNRDYDFLIDIQERSYFDGENNEWKVIEEK